MCQWITKKTFCNTVIVLNVQEFHHSEKRHHIITTHQLRPVRKVKAAHMEAFYKHSKRDHFSDTKGFLELS